MKYVVIFVHVQMTALSGEVIAVWENNDYSHKISLKLFCFCLIMSSGKWYFPLRIKSWNILFVSFFEILRYNTMFPAM